MRKNHKIYFVTLKIDTNNGDFFWKICFTYLLVVRLYFLIFQSLILRLRLRLLVRLRIRSRLWLWSNISRSSHFQFIFCCCSQGCIEWMSSNLASIFHYQFNILIISYVYYVETYTYLSTSRLLIFFTFVNIFYMFYAIHLCKYFRHTKLHRHIYYSY